MKYIIERTNKFIKNYAKMLKRQEFNESEFINVLNKLVNNEVLPEKYNNHLLEPKKKRYMGVSHTKRCFT